MSTTESDSVKNVREKIIQLAKEIEEHSRSNMPPEKGISPHQLLILSRRVAFD